MAWIRIRKIGNQHYRYEESRRREGKRVVATSTYLGPVNGGHFQGEVAAFDSMVKQFEKDQAEALAKEATKFDQSQFLAETQNVPADAQPSAGKDESAEASADAGKESTAGEGGDKGEQ